MAPSTPESTWRPLSSPRAVASSVVASLQYVTSSVRLLLIGCFQCGSLKAGCWDRQEEQDGAWFDCEKLQVEHPFCYINPVALSDGTLTAPDAALTTLPQPSLLERPTTKANGLHPGRLPPARRPPSTHDTSVTTVVSGSGDHKDGVVIYKNAQVRSLFLESFAAKLEADLRKLECDRQRAEGEVLSSPEERWVADDAASVSEYFYTEGQCEADFFEDSNPDTKYHYENLDDERRPENEVWKPSELEDVFECYNMAAFYSYGATMPINEKFSPKTKGEKYEEVFPITFHNNNTIKVFRPASESESPLPLSPKEETLKENSTEVRSVERKLTVTEGQLKEFIHTCIFADDVNAVLVPCAEGTSANIVCDDSIEFDGRSFNKLLIFDLVKSIMSECTERYAHSVSMCVNYPVHLVQNRVLSVLQEDKDKMQPIPCGLQVFRNSTLLSASENELQQNQLMTQKLIDKLVASELRTQDKQWQNFIQEELEIKEAISTQLLHDLISETTNISSSVLRRKLI